MSYCDISDLSLWMNVTQVSTALLDRMIAAAQEYVDEETGDSWVVVAGATKLFSGNKNKLIIVSPSLTDPTSVQIMDEFNNWEVLETDEYDYGKGWLTLRYDYAYFPKGTNNIKITGTWGNTPVPSSLRMATARIASIFAGGKSKENIKSESLGSYSVSYGAAESSPDGSNPFSVENILEKYKLHPFYVGKAKAGRLYGETEASSFEIR